MEKKNVISVCMGSSCFSRGNNKTLQIIKKYIDDNNLKEKIFLKGSLCEGLCKDGPNIKINDKLLNNVEPNTIIDILDYYFKGDN